MVIVRVQLVPTNNHAEFDQVMRARSFVTTVRPWLGGALRLPDGTYQYVGALTDLDAITALARDVVSAAGIPDAEILTMEVVRLSTWLAEAE